ncbi:MAG: OmpA family protein [Candidatus Omnitrophica bacterium]|nr:OmpA family protein [Candidatus Omnitrophota bacterium]MCM8791354.1 OmpA family protein [Candidatus Omnitrophota bacterium]
MMKRQLAILMVIAFSVSFIALSFAQEMSRDARRKEELQKLQERFSWWGTSGAQPAPVRDPERGGYWWMPKEPGPDSPKIWGNRGYIYVYKIIFDYMEEELPAPKPKELRPSLLIKKILKNVKIYFDYDKADLRPDSIDVLDNAVGMLNRNKEASILITGNCDIRGTEQYNEKLGKRRGEAVKKYMLDNGIPESRIKIISRGKLDAIAPVTDLVGMAKDRNAQFMIAEVEEVMIPYTGPAGGIEGESDAKVSAPPIAGATQIEEGKYLIEKEEEVTGEIKVSTKEYITKKGDSLWKLAEETYGDGRKWKNIYRFNKDRIKDPNKLKPGTKIIIPIE